VLIVSGAIGQSASRVTTKRGATCMSGVFSTLLAPILALWIGALVFVMLDRLLEPQDRGIAETVVLVLSLGFLLAAGPRADVPLSFGVGLANAGWRGLTPFLFAGPVSWVLALVLLGSALAASLASLQRPTEGRAGRLAALGAALLFLFAGDWPTLVSAWMLLDLALLYALQPGSDPAIRRTAVLSLAGAICLGVALILWQQVPGSIWVAPAAPVDAHAATALPPFVAPLGIAAALLRLMPYPLPSWQAPAERQERRETRPIAQVVLFALPTLLGAYLWVRLAQWGVAAQGMWSVVLPLWAGVAMLVGGVKAWIAPDPDRLIAAVNTYGSAFVLLTMGLPLAATWRLAHGLYVVLSVAVLLVSWTQGQYFRLVNLRTYWRLVPAGLALLSLAGLPFSAGFPGRVGMYKAILGDQRWLVLLLAIGAESVFLGAMLRVLFGIESEAAPAQPSSRDALASGLGRVQWRREIAFGASMALAMAMVVLGWTPSRLALPGLGFWLALPTVPVWAAIVLPLIGAIVLYRSQDAILDALEGWRPLISRLIETDWPYQVIERALQQLRALIWGATQVVQGAGYMAWVVLACLVLLIFILAR
jgi:hypothetical protein